MIQKILSFFTAIFLSFFSPSKVILTPLDAPQGYPIGASPSPISQVILTQAPSPKTTPKLTETPLGVADYPTGVGDTGPWGVARQVGEHTWTMKIEDDPVMATPVEIFQALNEYRRLYGSAVLIWDDKLADYAQTRASFFTNNKGLDSHQGFANFLENDNGFNKLGFTSLGENASYGYRLNGVHLIEWIYAGDEPHDKNQKNSRWAYVGVGVDGTATCLIFATGKI